jgi:hypothetical protein
MELMVDTILPVKRNSSPSAEKKFEKIISKFGNGIDTEGRTKWDALNAVTEFESHQKTSPTKFIRNLTMSTLSTKAYKYLSAA